MSGFGTKKRQRVASMRHRAWLQERVKSSDPNNQLDERGQPIFQWENVSFCNENRVPCTIELLYGRELERARQLTETATHRVTMRYLNGVTAKMRLLIDERALYIGNVDNLDESNRFLVLFCEEEIQ